MEAGHAVRHRTYDPSKEDVITLMDLTEHIVETVYLQVGKVNRRQRTQCFLLTSQDGASKATCARAVAAVSCSSVHARTAARSGSARRGRMTKNVAGTPTKLGKSMNWLLYKVSAVDDRDAAAK